MPDGWARNRSSSTPRMRSSIWKGTGRRFTGWVVFDQTKTKKGEPKDNYIALMKNLSTEGPIDFTRLWILIYSPAQGRYVSAPIDGSM